MKFLYTTFAVAALLDIVISPLFLTAAWLPSFILATLPFLILFSLKKELVTVSVLSVLIFWLAGGLNLGIAVIAVGLMIFFERWALLKVFQHNTWQILALSALSVIIFGLVVALLGGVFLGDTGFLSTSFVLRILVSATLAVLVNLRFGKVIKTREHEGPIF